MSHPHARDPICPQMLAATICRNSDSGNSGGSAVRFETPLDVAGRHFSARSEMSGRLGQVIVLQVERRIRPQLLLDSWRCGVRQLQVESCSCNLMLRVRHCLECPKCRTRYFPGSSPYDNGSYLMPRTEIGLSGWILYCSCGSPRALSEWPWNELKPYKVCGPAYHRGYGSPDEVRNFRRTTRM